MSLAKLKQALNIFGGTVDVIRGVGQNASDDVYCGLGYTQAICMVMLTTAWLVVMFPELGLSPIGDAYAALYNVTKKELNDSALSHGIVNYLLWGAGAILSVRLGARVGQMVWGIHCLLRTCCRSSHTMDLPLRQSERDRVIDNLLPAFAHAPELDVNHVGRKRVLQRRNDVISWVHQVLLFFSDKQTSDKKKGKFLSAQQWWDDKKQFRLDMEVIRLYQRLQQYHRLLEKRKVFVEGKLSLIQHYLQPNNLPVRRELLQLLQDVLCYFKKGVVLRHQRRYKQRIFNDVKVLRRIINRMTFESHNTESLTQQMQAAYQLLEKVLSRLQQQQQAIPLGPVWLQVGLQHAMRTYYKRHAMELTSEAAGGVLSDVLNLSAQERGRCLPGLIQMYCDTVTTPVPDNVESKAGNVSVFPSHRRVQSDDIVGRAPLIEMSGLNRV